MTHPVAQPGSAGAEAPRSRREPLSHQDAQELRLLLRGDSAVDWHRLDLAGPDDVRRMLRLAGLDVDDEADLRRLQRIRERAARYLGKTLRLRLDPYVAEEASALELPLLASGHGKHQRHACVMLKVMHIAHHLDARELATALPVPNHELFTQVEASVTRMFEELRGTGTPVREFAWSRKSRTSLITKLLVKRETSAAQVFDRLRFRLIVERREDLIPTLHVMLRRCIPFNYIVPEQTVNTLVDIAEVDRIDPLREDTTSDVASPPPANEFSAPGYHVLNFVSDLPVRIDDLFPDDPETRALAADRGRVVFVLAEFQIVDAATADANETGDSSHSAYKRRQHQRVRERLLREPRVEARHEGDDGGGT